MKNEEKERKREKLNEVHRPKKKIVRCESGRLGANKYYLLYII